VRKAEHYKVTLTVRTPVHIGSGAATLKKMYLYDRKSNMVSFVDTQKLFNLIIDNDLLELYEDFMLRQNCSLTDFLVNQCKFTSEQLEPVITNSVSAADALGERPIADIHRFMRDAHGRVYIPGSSLKGALRTALLLDMIDADGQRPQDTFDSFDYRDREAQRVARNHAKQLETRYLHTVRIEYEKYGEKKTVKPEDARCDIMHGVSVSDSLPIDDSRIILCRKDDFSVRGNKNSINLVRECLRPGTTVEFVLTLTGGITIEQLRTAVSSYYGRYYDTYVYSFDAIDKEAQIDDRDCIVLGGGNGYFGKNIVYAVSGKEKGTRFVSSLLQWKFYKHRHQNDSANYGISPRMLKYTQFNRQYYLFGLCKVEFAPINFEV